jgi:hypothetical protein
MPKKKDFIGDSAGGDTSKRGMPEPAAGAGTPHPTGQLGSAMEMPTPAMISAVSHGEMPARGMDDPVTSVEMPTTSMSDPIPGSVMPTGSMSKGGEDDKDASRFGPPNLAPGTIPAAQLEPGVVEVEFKEGVVPTINPAARGASVELSSPTGANLGEFNRIMQVYGLQKAEKSLVTSPQEAASVQTAAREQGIDLPNLGNFVTLRFPEGADTPQIARELETIDSVVRAVAVPKAIPPQTPLNEPLVGTNDQVAINPVTGLENQWYLFRTRANQAWAMSSGAGVVVADVDWGYRTTHQDLAARLDLTHAYNAVDGGTNVSFGGNIDHGTGVMGLAGGDDNNLGIAGIAWGATLWPVQANDGPGTPLGGNSWARGIDWVRTAK